MSACERSTGDAEKLSVGERTMIWRLGPEQDDGAIVGTLYELVPTSRTTVAARRAGIFRIEPEGRLVSGPDWLRALLPRNVRTDDLG